MFTLYLQGPDYAPTHPMGTTGELLDVIEHIGFFNVIIIIFLIISVISMLIGFIIAKPELLNHWNILIKGLEYSPLDFYKQLEEELKSEGIEGLRITTHAIPEGSFVSARRQYATIAWKEYKYSVCAAPFAKSFFVSYRSLGKTRFWKYAFTSIPFLGKHFKKGFGGISWYKEDTIMMFHTIVHESIVKVVNEVAEGQNLERIPESQCIPKVRDIFER